MGLRKASGTKPSMLAGQVPGQKEEVALQEEIQQSIPSERVEAAPTQPMPEATPSPTPAPTTPEMGMGELPTEDQMGVSALPTEDQFADLPTESTLPGLEGEFSFKFLMGGRKGRIVDGKAEFYDEDSKKWKEPEYEAKLGASFILDALANAPSMAGGIAGGALGSKGGLPLAILGAGAGAALGGMYNKEALEKIRSNPDLNKYITALEAVAGEPAQSLEPLSAALIEMAGEGIGGLLMKGGRQAAKLATIEERQAGKAFTGAAEEAAQLAASSERMGVPVSAAEFAAMQPGGASFAEKGALLRSGLLGEGYKTQYENQTKIQRDKLVGILQDAKKMVGGEEAMYPEFGIGKTAKEGFEKINIVDRHIKNFQETLGSLRRGVSETARQVKYNPAQLMEQVKPLMASFPGSKQFMNASGDINIEALRQYSKDFLGSDQDAKLLADQVRLLQNMINTNSAFAQSQGSRLAVQNIPASTEIVTSAIPTQYPGQKPTQIVEGFRFTPERSQVAPGTGIESIDRLPPTISGPGEGGFTFDDISSLVDRFQELAVKTDDPKIKQLAGIALDYENTIMKKAYQDAGNPEMANVVQAAKDVYSSQIDDLRLLKKRIQTGIDKGTLGAAILDLPEEQVKLFKSFLNPNELAEARMSAFNSAVLDQQILNPEKQISASKIEKIFLSGKKRPAMVELFGEDGVKNLQAIFNIAKVLENKSLKPEAYKKVTNDLTGAIIESEKNLGLLKKGQALLGFITGGNDEAARMLRQNISKYAEVAKPQPKTLTKATARFAEDLGKGIKGAGQAKALLFEDLMQTTRPEQEQAQ